jgi:hypothetical protein
MYCRVKQDIESRVVLVMTHQQNMRRYSCCVLLLQMSAASPSPCSKTLCFQHALLADIQTKQLLTEYVPLAFLLKCLDPCTT